MVLISQHYKEFAAPCGNLLDCSDFFRTGLLISGELPLKYEIGGRGPPFKRKYQNGKYCALYFDCNVPEGSLESS